MKKSIYIIKNNINNKVYIGQSLNPEKRFKEHCYFRKDRNNSLITNAIHKYGKEHFWFELLEENIEDFDEKEIFYISKYNSIKPNGYNIEVGGNSGNCGFSSIQSAISKEKWEKIVLLLQDSQLTMKEIAKKFNISATLLYRINSGKSYYDEALKYPIRFYHQNNKLKNTDIDDIYFLLKKTYLYIDDIAKMYNVSSSTINKINRGESHYRENIEYPIRKGRVTSCTALEYDQVDKIIEILKNSDISINKIAKIYNVAVSTIKDINTGASLLHRRENQIYPIRHY